MSAPRLSSPPTSPSIIVTTYLAFAERVRRRQDDDSAARPADPHHCEIVETGNESWRLKTAPEYRCTPRLAPVCVFRGKSATDSGMTSATDSDLISAIPI